MVVPEHPRLRQARGIAAGILVAPIKKPRVSEADFYPLQGIFMIYPPEGIWKVRYLRHLRLGITVKLGCLRLLYKSCASELKNLLVTGML